MNRRAAAAVSLVAFATLALVACRPQLRVALTTRVHVDGSLERRVEIWGRDPDGNVPTEDGWLRATAGVSLADPGAWARVETDPAHLVADGYFRTAADVPPVLRHDTDVGDLDDRVQTGVDIRHAAVLTRWIYRELHGDAYSPESSANALNALSELAVEAVVTELEREFGSKLDTVPAATWIRETARPLAASLLSIDRRLTGFNRMGRREEMWRTILAQSGVPAVPADADADDDFWSIHLPVMFEWARAEIATALTGPETVIVPEDMSFWPIGDELEEQAGAIVERTWGDSDEFLTELEPHFSALSGYYGNESPKFRFEVRVELPGRLIATNGTPDGTGSTWFFRSSDLRFGITAVRAESVEPNDETLVTLGARRRFDTVQLLQLADLLFERDHDGVLAELLDRAVRAGALTPLRDPDNIPDEWEDLSAELADLLDPDVAPGTH